MALTLTVTDLQNGGGLTLSLSGVTVGAGVQFYRQSLPAPDDNWFAVGPAQTVAADPLTLTTTVPTGYHWFYAAQTTGGVTTPSNLVRQVVRGAAAPIWHQIGQSMQATIQDAVSAGSFAKIT